jgi:hypothetical protein
VIVDEQEALICLSRDGKDGVPESANWANQPELVGFPKEVFGMLWSAFIDGNIRIREIERI